MDEWQVKVERFMVKIDTDMEYLKTRMSPCEKEKLRGMIKSNRWILGLFISSYTALLGVLFSKI